MKQHPRGLVADAHRYRRSSRGVMALLACLCALVGTSPAAVGQPGKDARLKALGALGAGGPAVGTVAPGVSQGQASVRLLSQSSWTGPGPGELKFRLQLTATNVHQDALAVEVYGPLSARSQFQAALGGTDVGAPMYNPPSVPLLQLKNDPQGGVDLDIPVGQPGGLAPTTTGVYPVQIFLENGAEVRTGSPLNTFMVYVGADAANFRHLDVSVVLPLSARAPVRKSGVSGPVSATAARLLDGDAEDIARSLVPVTLRPAVTTLEALAAGSSKDKVAVNEVAAGAVAGDEVLPSTGLPIDIGAFETSGFTGDLTDEVGAGQATLLSLLGSAPSLTTWAFLADVGPSTVDGAIAQGANRLVLPQTDLADLPSSNQGLTFAQPTTLTVQGHRVDVVGADPELSSRVRLAVGAQAALVGYQVLAELAMIDLEEPSDSRGVVVMPPAGTIASPAFVSVLLDGLDNNPMLNPVTVGQLFDDVPLATSNSGPVTLTNERSSPGLGGVTEVLSARAAVHADAEVYGKSFPLVSKLGNLLVTSLSSSFSTAQRARIIAGARAAARSELDKVHLPPSISITLTSRQGKLPLTLVSDAPAPMKVRLVLTSEQLSFVPKHLPDGTCSEVYPGAEACELTLDHATTTLEVPVVVRSPGAFPLSLLVQTPDGVQRLASGTDTVRVTALSDVGLALMASAAVFLGFWWVRNARHGRRARKLVPRPLELTPDVPPRAGTAS